VSCGRICGWEADWEECPAKPQFSRAFAEFARSELPARVACALIEQYQARLIGHISEMLRPLTRGPTLRLK